MSAVERVEDQVLRPAPREAATAVKDGGGTATTPPESPKKPRGNKLRPLLALGPYVARYRGQAFAALVALIVASVATLVVPLAVRRMIDFGFSPEGIALINSYFAVMNKLRRINLEESCPGVLDRLFYGTHPSYLERVQLGHSFAKGGSRLTTVGSRPEADSGG